MKPKIHQILTNLVFFQNDILSSSQDFSIFMKYPEILIHIVVFFKFFVGTLTEYISGSGVHLVIIVVFCKSKIFIIWQLVSLQHQQNALISIN